MRRGELLWTVVLRRDGHEQRGVVGGQSRVFVLQVVDEFRAGLAVSDPAAHGPTEGDGPVRVGVGETRVPHRRQESHVVEGALRVGGCGCGAADHDGSAEQRQKSSHADVARIRQTLDSWLGQ